MNKSLIEIVFPETAKMLGTKEEFERSQIQSGPFVSDCCGEHIAYLNADMTAICKGCCEHCNAIREEDQDEK